MVHLQHACHHCLDRRSGPSAGHSRAKARSLPTEDGAEIYADVYGEGGRAIVLAHGGRFNKESWEKQARALTSAGLRVLALDFRGYGVGSARKTYGTASSAT